MLTLILAYPKILIMRTFYVLVIFILYLNANAQQLSGLVKDPDEKTMAFINVVLYSNEERVDFAITNEKGEFTFENLKEGVYDIEISSLGYKKYRQTFSMPAKDFKLTPIILKIASEELDAVTVTAKKPVVDVQPDKTVLNVSQMATVAGDNTLELLRRAPSVRLDNDDNVILEGKSGITYYINGKQTYLTGDDLNNYLRSLTSDDIESIELITQPSSKYDAAGSAGVINIILKRVKGQGVKGSVASTFTLGNLPNVEIPIPDGSSNLGHEKSQPEINPRSNTSLNLTYRSERWDVAGNLSNNFGRSSGFLNLYRFQGNKIYDDRTNRVNNNLNNLLNLRTDYRVDDKHAIGGNINLNLQENENEGNNRTPIIDQNTRTIDSILIAPNQSDLTSFNLSTNINYRYKDIVGNMFTADIDYGKFTRDTDNFQPNFYITPDGVQLSQRINAQETAINIDIYAIKAVYETRLWGNQFSAGFKYSLVATDNDFDFFNVMENDRVLNNQRQIVFYMMNRSEPDM